MTSMINEKELIIDAIHGIEIDHLCDVQMEPMTNKGVVKFSDYVWIWERVVLFGQSNKELISIYKYVKEKSLL